MIRINPFLYRGDKPNVILVENSWMGGGAVRRWFTGEKQDSDIDIFFTGEKPLNNFIEENKLINKIYETENAISFKKNNQTIQLIKYYSPTPQDCIEKFDYYHCQFVSFEDGFIEATQEAIICALTKKLMVNNIQVGYELDSLRRAFKYYKQGYEPCLGCLKTIGESFVGIEQESLNTQLEISPGGGNRILRFD